MDRSTLARRTMLATAALTAVGLIAASPASAHTSNMYSYIDYAIGIPSGFTTISKTDGVATPLPTSTTYFEVVGIEVAAEQGVAIAYYESPVVFGWNHTTGEATPPVGAHLSDEALDFDGFSGLDTLNDGRTVTLVEFDADGASDQVWVATVDATSGLLTPVVNLSDVITDPGEDPFLYDWTSLATDPATGITYVFLSATGSGGASYFLPVNVAAGTHGAVTEFTSADFEDGEIYGADFDGDGTLFFIYLDVNPNVEYQLSKVGAPSTWPTTARQVISTAPAQVEDIELAELALTIEWAKLAATGSQVPLAAGLALGTVAVLAGGLTVMVARRRSERGTV